MQTFKKSLAALTFFLLLTTAGHADVVDRIVAIVNNDAITLSEVNQEGKVLMQRIAESVSPQERPEAIKQVRQKIIDKLIEKKIMEQEAEKANITVTDTDVDLAYQRIIEMNNLTPEVFQLQLAEMGMDEAQYRDELKTQVLSSKLVNLEVRSKVIIPEDRIIDYFDTHYTERMDEGGFYLLQIGIGWDEKAPAGQTTASSKEEAKLKAEEVQNHAIKGEDFKELARTYSNLPSGVDGGDIGVLRGDDMSSEMFEIISKTEVGNITPIIETSSGFQFFKVLSSKAGQIVTKVPYASVKEEIYEILYKQEMEKRYDEWLKKVKSKAYIKIL